MIYKPYVRLNNPIYLLRQVKELLKIAREYKNSSSLIYATLECRIALELLELNFLLHLVKGEEREQIIIDSKPKNGIDRVNSKVGSLKYKYQFFLQAICEILGIGNERFNYKTSKDLQYKVSTYVHSYHMNDSDLKYNSDNMQNCLILILEVDGFIKSSMPYKNGTWTMLGMEISSMTENDREIFEEWKVSNKMTYDELKEKLSKNHKTRTKPVE